ncbi:MAG TPA: TMEM175 family protein [Chloroflexota bacterium]|nr:TMEM175 family protein [Chloroflexota bacterium]
MTKSRLEAFSDGVIAILITIMVLDLKAPAGAALSDLWGLAPELGMYALSFVIVGIYWNNHHHLFLATRRISGGVLWANLHLLFWLSLVPFVTRWLGQTDAAPLTTAAYGAVLLLAAVAYGILVQVLLHCQPPGSTLAKAVGGDLKGNVSIALYAAALPLAFVSPNVSLGLYTLVAIIWFVPDRRIESRLKEPAVD